MLRFLAGIVLCACAAAEPPAGTLRNDCWRSGGFVPAGGGEGGSGNTIEYRQEFSEDKLHWTVTAKGLERKREDRR